MFRILKKKVEKEKGFTLLELLVVMAVIGILAAVILVNLQSARQKANDTKVQEEVRNMMTALETHIAVNGDAADFSNGCTIVDIVAGGILDTKLVGNELSVLPVHPGTPNLSYRYGGVFQDGVLNYVVYGQLTAGDNNGKFFVAKNGATSIQANEPVDCN